MKVLFSIFVAFNSLILFGQSNTELKATPYSAYSIFIYDTIPKNYLKDSFFKYTKYKKYTLTFDSNMTFHYMVINAHSDTLSKSGDWQIQNADILELKSSKKTLKFNFAKYGKCNFIFWTSQKQKFKDDLISQMKIYRIRINDKSMTQLERDKVLYMNMCKKYFCQIRNKY